jgi:ligand-binding SRPBCC domain-containing protein
MPVITLHTAINAPIDVVFNLSRSVDLHKISAAHTTEVAVAGRTTGLMQQGEAVTWQARHFGIRQKLTVHITHMQYPAAFTDQMLPGRGAFKSMVHRHIFEEKGGSTLMSDVFTYQSPLGMLGRLADMLFLERYMRRFLIKRNAVIKAFAEDPQKWQQVPGIKLFNPVPVFPSGK